MAAGNPQNSPENNAVSSNPTILEPPIAPTSHTESSEASTKPKKRRMPIDDALRRKIRRHNQEHPGGQAQLIQWVIEETGRKLQQSTISDILSAKYDYLDLDERKDRHLTTQRHNKSDWPDLEAALFEWHQKMQKQKATLTGDVLKAKAHEFWIKLPQYQDEKEPAWSNGWLHGFKRRHNIKEYVYYGEAASAEVNLPERINEMDNLRDKCNQYSPKDKFNMDESGLWWKLQPNRTLATEGGSGSKASKDRVTVAFTCNADGSEKMDVWLIGRYKNPRCFKNVNRSLLGIEYRFNTTKWMTGVICAEFLRWFNNKMRGRKVLLLMDNFSGHELGVELVGGKTGLSNVEIEFLPKNTTSCWQPLDQGVISQYKLAYRKLWVSYMIKEFDAGRDPNKTVTLLHAVRWTAEAWNQVKSISIQRCWWKSTCDKKPTPTPTLSISEPTPTPTLSMSGDDEDWLQQQREDQEERCRLQAQILDSLYLRENALPIDEFINPASEVIIENDTNLTEVLVERYSVIQEVEPEEEEQEVEKVTLTEAQRALEVLQLYELQCPEGRKDIVSKLESIKCTLNQRQQASAKQKGIMAFFQRVEGQGESS
jgi:hypothetical protein